ncbi:GntR family transcriptional regulator [Marinobacterium nitratireducens]|uniref:GntR family transcriptional regulator n=1 Tax=Marinobacterium nitratireducens TaxID=518897 RepID=A0A917ZNZ9_9GAMM|nr:S1-like domain-containing RNA-binding protein [Marinobacterium nitratireducens]GGO86768.1 GntR family transcriptional regulator [Marinobacterium nitratireducens]
MADLGRFNRLQVIKQKDFGVYLDGGELGEILLPARYVPADCKTGDWLEVFVSLDSEDYLVATTQKPLAQVGDFALLRCADVTKVGAFLDWGLPKQLLAPFGEQHRRMEAGKSYLVHILIDRSDRIVASSKLDRFLDRTPANYRDGQAVDLVIANRTDLGFKAIVDGQHWGLIHQSDLFRRVHFGQQIRGYVKRVRPDGKLDLCLDQPGYNKVDGLAGQILERLRVEGGFIAAHDKTDPDTISRLFGCSKKAFKMAIGSLFKQRLIEIGDDGIRLTDSQP